MLNAKKYPRLVIAGAASGSGKTTITSGLIKTLIKKGLKVQSYKAGPDYIDNAYLSYVAGSDSYNLDKWLMGKENIKNTFINKSSGVDISIIEGVMGLYDGGDCSTAEVAKMLECPVILCINASKAGESIAAVARGFIDYDPRVNIWGIILNMVSGESHYNLIKNECLKRLKDIEVIGYIKKDKGLEVSERHLGLTTVFESGTADEFIKQAAEKVQAGLDMEKIIEIARKAPGIGSIEYGTEYKYSIKGHRKNTCRKKIYYTFDRAFNFFYKQNLEFMEEAGAECIPFSPLEDRGINGKVDLLILWGGFPEVFAPELSCNGEMISWIRNYIKSGGNVYAECGGFMYLASCFIAGNAKKYPMAGHIPVDIKLGNRLAGFGYKEAIMRYDTFLGKAGTKVLGHEFHYSHEVGDINEGARPYEVRNKSKNMETQSISLDGYFSKNIFASYIHLHFLGNREVAGNILKNSG